MKGESVLPRKDLINLINASTTIQRNESSVSREGSFYLIFAIMASPLMPTRLVRTGPGIMGVIFSAAVHCAAAYDVQRNMHMNDHADSPFVLLSWSARKCICIMQRLIGVMGNVITASTVHYFRLILPAQFC